MPKSARSTLADLAPEGDLAFARNLLRRYETDDEEQEDARAFMLAWIEHYPLDAHLRTRLEGHLTASALIVNHARTHALLTHHKKLGRWLQLGGHCDGDANLAHVALRECFEESGIEGLAIDPVPIDLDIHDIPARPGEPEHMHLDTRFVVYAPSGATPVISDESNELRWIAPSELAALGTDESVQRLYRRIFTST